MKSRGLVQELQVVACRGGNTGTLVDTSGKGSLQAEEGVLLGRFGLWDLNQYIIGLMVFVMIWIVGKTRAPASCQVLDSGFWSALEAPAHHVIPLMSSASHQAGYHSVKLLYVRNTRVLRQWWRIKLWAKTWLSIDSMFHTGPESCAAWSALTDTVSWFYFILFFFLPLSLTTRK